MAAKTKEDIINQVAKDTGISKAQTKKAIESFLNTITDGMKNDGKVTLTGFGTFQVQKREARNGRNPQTGEKLLIPAKQVPKFTPGKALKDSVSD